MTTQQSNTASLPTDAEIAARIDAEPVPERMQADLGVRVEGVAGHTPGPWEQQQCGKPCRPYIIAVTVDPDYSGIRPRTTVAAGNHTGGQGWPAIGGGGIPRSQAEANARLIAAAPDLLDALKRAVSHAEGSDDCDWIGAAEAAIAKATTGATHANTRGRE